MTTSVSMTLLSAGPFAFGAVVGWLIARVWQGGAGWRAALFGGAFSLAAVAAAALLAAPGVGMALAIAAGAFAQLILVLAVARATGHGT